MKDLKKELQLIVEELNILAIRTDDLLKIVIETEKADAKQTDAKQTKDTNKGKARPKKSKPEKPEKKSTPKKSQSKKAAPQKAKSKTVKPKTVKPKKVEPKKVELDRDGIIKIIMDKKKEGASFETIAQYLESHKIPTLSGKGQWRKQSVHKLYQQNK